MGHRYFYPNMNQGGPPDMYYQHNMSAGPPPPQQSGPPHYGHPQGPALLHPGQSQYAQPPHYGQHYGYANGLTSPPGGPQGVSGPMGPGSNVLPLPNVSQQGLPAAQYQQQGFDTTGQVAPPGMKPRVTATLWEDEGSLCFQVEARGICVARREDNHMINGTKLLNVAGMTRGRRDGILKSEKLRHVVKIGPMHLKGVWIPFERALDFANKEKITELLYPLFVHNIGALLYHPTNQNRTSQVMAVAAEQRRKQDQAQMRGGPPGGLPSLQQHHHHSIPLPGPPPPLSSHQHPSMGRPTMDRTFPTPPTSASSIMGGVGANDNFQWGPQQGMSNGQGPNPISIDTALSNGNIPDSHSARGPNTPATTPPGNSVQSMQNYPPVSQSYDSSRQMYQQGSQPQPPSYQSSNPPRQEPPLYQGPYVKSEMGPPSSRPVGSGSEQADSKPPNGLMHSGQQENGSQHQSAEDEGEHEHEAEYTHDGGAYDANRGSYNYGVPPPAPISSDHSHISPEISGSPHQAGSGRATPRTAPAPQAYYTQGGGYHTPPPRVGQQSSNLYSVISNDRGSASGPSGSDGYASQSEMNGSLPNGYAPPPVMNGNSSGLKRGRDDEDDRPTSGGNGMGQDLKRRKTMLDGSSASAPSPTYNMHNPPMAQPAPVIAPQRRR